MFACRWTHQGSSCLRPPEAGARKGPTFHRGGRHAAGQALGRLLISQRRHQGRSKKRSSITQYVYTKTLNVN